VVNVTLARVETAIQEHSYGIITGKDDDNNPEVLQVVKMKHVNKAIQELREK
jgi:hypothetical protein